MKTITDITPTLKKKEKIRLAAYCRVSSNSEEQLHSYAAQIRYYKGYETEHPEYELVDIYADEGITGTEMAKRDELARLLKDCKNGKVDRIIVKSISRLARNTEELLITIRMLKEIGVSIYFEEQGIDTDKLNAEMIVTFPGMVAQQESMAISGNLRWGVQKRMEAGTFKHSKPAYGFNIIDGNIVINQEEAKVIRLIFQLFLQGYSKRAIAEKLNEEQIGGKTWKRNSIMYILNNEKYKGDALLQKKYKTDTLPFRQKLNHGEKAMYYVENYNEPIIDKETYQAAQDLIARRRAEQGQVKVFPLSKMIRCPDCGRLFSRNLIRGKAYWSCSLLNSNDGKCCKSRRVKEEMVYDAFTSMVYKLQAHRELIIGTLMRDLEIIQCRGSDNHERIRQIDKEVSDLSAKNLFISRLHSSGILSISDYTSQSAEIANKIAELRKERKKKLSEDKNDLMLEELSDLNDMIKDYKPNGRFSIELFEQIVEKIEVKDNCEIIFHLLGSVALREKIKEKGRCKTA